MSEFAATLHLEGTAADRYRAAARALGASLAGETFDIDRAGVCPALLEALSRATPPLPRGATAWILTGPAQGRVLHTSERFSFEGELLDRLFGEGLSDGLASRSSPGARQQESSTLDPQPSTRSSSTLPLLEALASTEALACLLTIAPAPASSLDDLPAMESVKLEIRSESGAVARLVQLLELDRGLDRPENYLSRDYVQSMVDAVLEVSGLVPGFARLRMPELSMATGSFCAPAFGSVYLIQGEPQDLLIHPPPYRNPDLEETYRGLASPMKLSHPGLVEKLRELGAVRYDVGLLARRLEEIENEILLAAGVDPMQIQPRERGPALAAHRAALPRTWHELTSLQSNVRRHPASAEGMLPKLSAEARVKLAVPARDTTALNRLLSDLDHIDYVRFHRYNRVRFASHFEGFSDTKKRYVRQLVHGEARFPKPPEAGEPGEAPDTDDITFLDDSEC